MPAKRDCYDILGVPRDANTDVIKKAYRKIARENHPDVKPGDDAAAARFMEATEAYDILSDGEKRRKYDLAGYAALESSVFSQPFTTTAPAPQAPPSSDALAASVSRILESAPPGDTVTYAGTTYHVRNLRFQQGDAERVVKVLCMDGALLSSVETEIPGFPPASDEQTTRFYRYATTTESKFRELKLAREGARRRCREVREKLQPGDEITIGTDVFGVVPVPVLGGDPVFRLARIVNGQLRILEEMPTNVGDVQSASSDDYDGLYMQEDEVYNAIARLNTLRPQVGQRAAFIRVRLEGRAPIKVGNAIYGVYRVDYRRLDTGEVVPFLRLCAAIPPMDPGSAHPLEPAPEGFVPVELSDWGQKLQLLTAFQRDDPQILAALERADEVRRMGVLAAERLLSAEGGLQVGFNATVDGLTYSVRTFTFSRGVARQNKNVLAVASANSDDLGVFNPPSDVELPPRYRPARQDEFESLVRDYEAVWAAFWPSIRAYRMARSRAYALSTYIQRLGEPVVIQVRASPANRPIFGNGAQAVRGAPRDGADAGADGDENVVTYTTTTAILAEGNKIYKDPVFCRGNAILNCPSGILDVASNPKGMHRATCEENYAFVREYSAVWREIRDQLLAAQEHKARQMAAKAPRTTFIDDMYAVDQFTPAPRLAEADPPVEPGPPPQILNQQQHGGQGLGKIFGGLGGWGRRGGRGGVS